MQNKKMFVFISTVFLLALWIPHGLTLEKPTHEAINEIIANQTINEFSLNDYLMNHLGFVEGVGAELKGYSGKFKKDVKQRIWRWISEGGRTEDEPDGLLRMDVNRGRSNNHFHNPLETWDRAGLDSPYIILFPTPITLHYTGESSVVWAQNPNQDPGGNWSWHDARSYFYQALIATSKTQRESQFVNTFRALGQLMHLIQDASVPLHVRNDIHILYNYETWLGDIQNSEEEEDVRIYNEILSKNPIPFDESILDLTPNPLARIPIAKMLDTDQYSGSNPGITATRAIGIAEYTNANFFSEDTIFSNRFEYPSRTTSVQIADYAITDPRDRSRTVMRPYFKKVADGELGYEGGGYRLATAGLLRNYVMTHILWYRGLERNSLDEGVYEDYAKLLIPRAVGYSSGLLKYFFRGQLQVTAVPIVYKNGIQYLRVKIKNKTPTQETMIGGHFILTYQYTKTTPDGPQDVLGLAWAHYPIQPEANNTELLYASDQQREEDQDKEVIDFLIPDPIPLESRDSAKFTLTFKGALGNEEGAVIGKALTLGEIKFEEEWNNGLNGNHNWAHTDFNLLGQNPDNGTTSNTFEGDSLIKDNIRVVGHKTARVNESFLSIYYNNGQFKDRLPIKITPETYVQFKIDEMWINQRTPAAPGYTNDWQFLWFGFNNGLGIQYSTQGQGLYMGSNVGYFEFDPNLIIVDNIYDLFKIWDIAIPPGDLYLNEISFVQQLFVLDDPSTVQHHQHMEIDSIRIIEGKKQ